MCRYLSICSRQEKLYEGKKKIIKKLENATTEYIKKKTSRYPQLVQAPLYPGPGSVWEAECWSRTQEPAEGCSSERRSGCRLRAAPVTCCPYTGQDALYTINTDTVPYPVHYTPYTCSCNAITTFHTAPYSYPLALYCSSGDPEFKENFGKLPFAIFNTSYVITHNYITHNVKNSLQHNVTHNNFH